MMMRSQAEALARLVHELRDEWDERGLMVAIHRAHELGSPGDVSLALIQLAGDPQVRTPGMLPMPGKHWRGTKTSKVRRDPMCEDHPDQPAGRCRECAAQGVSRPVDFKATVAQLRARSAGGVAEQAQP